MTLMVRPATQDDILHEVERINAIFDERMATTKQQNQFNREAVLLELMLNYTEHYGYAVTAEPPVYESLIFDQSGLLKCDVSWMYQR